MPQEEPMEPTDPPPLRSQRNQEQRQQYIREVIFALSGQTPEEYRMSSAEFDVLAKWMDANIPLRVVLQAIEQVVERQRSAQWADPTLKLSRNAVAYIKPAVEQEIRRWQRALA